MTATHHLKCHPEPFAAIAAGLKSFDFRLDDRSYQVGDVLHLDEWDPSAVRFTGNALRRRVSYILRGGAFGLPAGWCIMALEPPELGGIAQPLNFVRAAIAYGAGMALLHRGKLGEAIEMLADAAYQQGEHWLLAPFYDQALEPLAQGLRAHMEAWAPPPLTYGAPEGNGQQPERKP